MGMAYKHSDRYQAGERIYSAQRAISSAIDAIHNENGFTSENQPMMKDGITVETFIQSVKRDADITNVDYRARNAYPAFVDNDVLTEHKEVNRIVVSELESRISDLSKQLFRAQMRLQVTANENAAKRIIHARDYLRIASEYLEESLNVTD